MHLLKVPLLGREIGILESNVNSLYRLPQLTFTLTQNSWQSITNYQQVLRD